MQCRRRQGMPVAWHQSTVPSLSFGLFPHVTVRHSVAEIQLSAPSSLPNHLFAPLPPDQTEDPDQPILLLWHQSGRKPPLRAAMAVDTGSPDLLCHVESLSCRSPAAL